MGFFRKKAVKKEVKIDESELPELPELPRLPDLPRLPNLQTERSFSHEPLYLSPIETPKFSDKAPPKLKTLPRLSAAETRITQEAVKSSVAPPIKTEKKLTLELPESESSLKTSFYMPSQMPITEPEIEQIIPMLTRSSRKIEPVYIRIDKFKTAISSFQDIQDKISEISNLLKEIKEQKREEDEELRGWEKDIETIKARIEAIDKNIFSRIE